MTQPQARSAALPLGVVVALFAASLALRPQILAVGPLLPLIRADLELPAGIAGLLTTIPVLCIGVFAPIGPQIAARLGPRTALAACLAVIAGAGLARALAPGVPLILLATFVIGIEIGVSVTIQAIVVAQRISHAEVHVAGEEVGRCRRTQV